MKNGDENEVGDENKVSDVHALLAQKEKDLILAAELGKALLEKMKISANIMKKWRKTSPSNLR